MPIPAPRRYVRSNLTKEQRQEQLAACYGVTMQNELSFEEVERMRQIVQMHDAKRRPMQTIDLNNPPKEPYRFQRFPKMLYDLEKSVPGHHVTHVVRSEAELKAALEAGWSDQAPPFGTTPEENLSAAYQGEVARLEDQLQQARRRPGRPSNAELAARRGNVA